MKLKRNNFPIPASIVLVILSLLLISVYSEAQTQFKFNDCFNKWSNFVAMSKGITARAAYIKNSSGDSWHLQFMNPTSQEVDFTYTVFGASSQFTQPLNLKANSVSAIVSGNTGLGNLYGVDIFVAVGDQAVAAPTSTLNGKTSWQAGEEIALRTAYGSGGYRLQFQSDGNLVIYKMSDCAVEYTTWTNDQNAYQCIFQYDGNLVIYAKDSSRRNKALWNTGTNGQSGAWVQFNPDGNLVVYTKEGGVAKPKWDMFRDRAKQNGKVGPFPGRGSPCYN